MNKIFSNHTQFSRRMPRVRLELIVFLALAALMGIAAWCCYGVHTSVLQSAHRAASYAACQKSAGSKIQDSYPSICVTKDGQRFVNPNESVGPIQNTPAPGGG